jgi:hypothetical protein
VTGQETLDLSRHTKNIFWTLSIALGESFVRCLFFREQDRVPICKGPVNTLPPVVIKKNSIEK